MRGIRTHAFPCVLFLLFMVGLSKAVPASKMETDSFSPKELGRIAHPLSQPPTIVHVRLKPIYTVEWRIARIVAGQDMTNPNARAHTATLGLWGDWHIAGTSAAAVRRNRRWHLSAASAQSEPLKDVHTGDEATGSGWGSIQPRWFFPSCYAYRRLLPK